MNDSIHVLLVNDHAMTRITFLLVQLLDSLIITADNVNGLLPTLIEGTGFVQVWQTIYYATIFGTLSLYKAQKPQGIG